MTASKSLALLKQQHLFRQASVIKLRTSTHLSTGILNYINFASNDYLGLAMDTSIANMLIEGVHQHGFGSSASVAVCGYSQAQQTFEIAMADFLQRERAVFFNSGYHANIGVLSALLQRHDQLLIDKQAHASLYDGILLSRAKYKRYPHQDLAFISHQLQTNTPDWLITEGVFSIEGDISPLPNLLSLIESYVTQLIIDDAHGIGVLGKNGGGICDYFQMNNRKIACLITPLGKAFGGMGAIVSGSHTLIEHIIQHAKSYRYTTALPPALFHALHQSLLLIKTQAWRREVLHERIAFFINVAKQLGLSLSSTAPTPIKTLVIGDNRRCLQLQQQLQQRGFFVAVMRPPTVSPHRAALRITLSCMHTEKMIFDLLSHLSRLLA